MEFSELDHHCKTCKQLDFMPFKCDFCNEMFCLEHKDPNDHDCKNCHDPNILKEPKNITNYESKKCFQKRCKNKVYVQTCNNCGKNYCTAHRFQHCSKLDYKPIQSKPIKKKKRCIFRRDK